MFAPGQMLISGVEPHSIGTEALIAEGLDEQLWRVFIGPRWRGRYIVVGNAEGHNVYAAFHGSQHLYAGIPDDADRFDETPEEREALRLMTQAEEKQRYYDIRDLMERTRP